MRQKSDITEESARKLGFVWNEIMFLWTLGDWRLFSLTEWSAVLWHPEFCHAVDSHENGVSICRLGELNAFLSREATKLTVKQFELQKPVMVKPNDIEAMSKFVDEMTIKGGPLYGRIRFVDRLAKFELVKQLAVEFYGGRCDCTGCGAFGCASYKWKHSQNLERCSCSCHIKEMMRA